jgi:hypothetical protein
MARRTTSKRTIKGRAPRKEKDKYHFLQVKPIFSTAPVVPLGSGPILLAVRLEKEVTKTEIYDIVTVLCNDGKDGEMDHPKSVSISSGDRLLFSVKPTKTGWVFLRIIERTQKGEVPGAVHIV